MATLFGSSAAASRPPQQPMWPQPNAITASGLIPPGMIPMQPQALAPLPPLPAVPNMTNVNPNQSIIHDPSRPSQAPVQQHSCSFQPFPTVLADPNMTNSTEVSMQESPLSAQVLDTELAEPQRLTWLHVGAAKLTALQQPAGGPLGPPGPPAPQIPSINPEDWNGCLMLPGLSCNTFEESLKGQITMIRHSIVQST